MISTVIVRVGKRSGWNGMIRLPNGHRTTGIVATSRQDQSEDKDRTILTTESIDHRNVCVEIVSSPD
jgi:hypothetical protein